MSVSQSDGTSYTRWERQRRDVEIPVVPVYLDGDQKSAPRRKMFSG